MFSPSILRVHSIISRLLQNYFTIHIKTMNFHNWFILTCSRHLSSWCWKFLNVKNVRWQLLHWSTCSLCSVWMCSLFRFDVLKCSSQYGHFVEYWQVLTWRSKLSFLFIFFPQDWHSLAIDPMWTVFSCRVLAVLNLNCFSQREHLNSMTVKLKYESIIAITVLINLMI